MSGGASPARKGSRLERAVVNILKAHGLDARRVPLSGAVKGYPGDVVANIAGREYILECKSRKEFKTLYNWLENRDALILKADRQEPLMVMWLGAWLNLIKE